MKYIYHFLFTLILIVIHNVSVASISIYELHAKNIDGREVSLSDFNCFTIRYLPIKIPTLLSNSSMIVLHKLKLSIYLNRFLKC